MTNKISTSVRKFNAGARKIERMIAEYAAGIGLDFADQEPIYKAMGKLEAGHRSAQWAVIAEHGADGPENAACNETMGALRWWMRDAVETRIKRTHAHRVAEIRRLDAEIAANRKVVR